MVPLSERHINRKENERVRGMNTPLKKQYYTVFVTLGAKPCHNVLYYFNVGNVLFYSRGVYKAHENMYNPQNKYSLRFA